MASHAARGQIYGQGLSVIEKSRITSICNSDLNAFLHNTTFCFKPKNKTFCENGRGLRHKKTRSDQKAEAGLKTNSQSMAAFS
jgi:hypothetical protein